MSRWYLNAFFLARLVVRLSELEVVHSVLRAELEGDFHGVVDVHFEVLTDAQQVFVPRLPF